MNSCQHDINNGMHFLSLNKSDRKIPMVDNSLSDFLDSETVSNLMESPLSLCVVNQ